MEGKGVRQTWPSMTKAEFLKEMRWGLRALSSLKSLTATSLSLELASKSASGKRKWRMKLVGGERLT